MVRARHGVVPGHRLREQKLDFGLLVPLIFRHKKRHTSLLVGATGTGILSRRILSKLHMGFGSVVWIELRTPLNDIKICCPGSSQEAVCHISRTAAANSSVYSLKCSYIYTDID